MSTPSSCPDRPVCPPCKSDETCHFVLQSQNECSIGVCQANQQQKSNAGAIAGGVVGGIVGFLLLVSLALWFYFKHRRSDDEGLLDDDFSSSSSPYDRHRYRPSVAASIATVNTNQARESNVIPVAYIPGVSVLPPIEEGGSGVPAIRHSIATTNYRASVPEMVMAVQGQPNLIQINGAEANPSTSTLGSSRPPVPPLSRQSSLNSGHGSQRSTGPGPGLSSTRYPWGPDAVDASNSMVAIPEDSENFSPVPKVIPPNSWTGSSRSSRRSSTWQGADRMSTVSRASSNGEYMLQLPEEAYLYHGGGFDTGSNRATLPDIFDGTQKETDSPATTSNSTETK